MIVLMRFLFPEQYLISIRSICTDVAQYNSSYYNPGTRVGLKAELEDSGRNPFAAKIAFRGLSCQCEQLLCSCCAGINVTAIKFNRVTCTKLTYDPQVLGIKMAFTMNEREIYTNTVSGEYSFKNTEHRL